MMLAQIFCDVFFVPTWRLTNDDQTAGTLQEIVNWTHPSDFAEGRPNGAQPERTIVTPKLRFFVRAFFGKEEVCQQDARKSL